MKKMPVPAAPTVAAGELRLPENRSLDAAGVHAQVYWAGEEPVGLILWTPGHLTPMVCLKDADSGSLVRFDHADGNDVPAHDRQQTEMGVDVQIALQEDTVLSVALAQHGDRTPFLVLAPNVEPAPHKLVYGKYPGPDLPMSQQLWFVGLYAAAGPALIAETGIDLRRVREVFGAAVADCIEHDRGDRMPADCPDNYRQTWVAWPASLDLPASLSRTAGHHDAEPPSPPYDPDDMDAAVAYAKQVSAHFGAGRREAAFAMWCRDPNGGAHAAKALHTQQDFEALMYAQRDERGDFVFKQPAGYALHGYTVGHIARLVDHGPWGAIRRVYQERNTTWLLLEFDRPQTNELNQSFKRVHVPSASVKFTTSAPVEDPKPAPDDATHFIDEGHRVRHFKVIEETKPFYIQQSLVEFDHDAGTWQALEFEPWSAIQELPRVHRATEEASEFALEP